MLENNQYSIKHKNLEKFFTAYTFLFLLTIIVAVIFLEISDSSAAFAFSILATGVACFFPLLYFSRGEWKGAFAPYSLIFVVNSISFLTLGLGAWNIQFQKASLDISLSSLFKAEIVIAFYQFLMSWSYLLVVHNKSKKYILLEVKNLSFKKQNFKRNFTLFGLILISITFSYLLLRLTIFSNAVSLETDSSQTGSASYALGLAFVSVYSSLICPAVEVCSVARKQFKFWQSAILLSVFVSLLQSTLRRDLISFFFSYSSSIIFFEKVPPKKIILVATIALPLTILLLFVGFVFRQIKQTGIKVEFSSYNSFLTNVLPTFYKKATDFEQIQLLWKEFGENILFRFLGLDPIARVLDQDIFIGGKATYYSLITIVPRFIWPDKPALGGKDEDIIVTLIQAQVKNDDYTTTYQLQLLADFGLIGLAISSILFGFIYATLHCWALMQKNESFNNIYYFIFYYNVINYTFEGAMSTMLVAFRQIIFAVVFLHLLDRFLLRKKLKFIDNKL